MDTQEHLATTELESPPEKLPPSYDSLDFEEVDILEWHTAYQACQQYFLDHAQHEKSIQAICAFINITLPFQWTTPQANSSIGQPIGHAVHNLPPPISGSATGPRGRETHPRVSLVPYIRRLIITGMDKEVTMQSLFGKDWERGVGVLCKYERQNFMFEAKCTGWAGTKRQYDMSPHESTPFIKPLQNVCEAEIKSAEKMWSHWLAMEDWMLGSRAPDWYS